MMMGDASLDPSASRGRGNDPTRAVDRSTSIDAEKISIDA